MLPEARQMQGFFSVLLDPCKFVQVLPNLRCEPL